MWGAPRGHRFAGKQDGQQTRGDDVPRYIVPRTFPEGLHIHIDADGATKAVQLAARTPPPPSPRGSMSAGNGMYSIPDWLMFRRIIDIPFEVCAAALDSWSSHEGHDGELLIGRSVIRGPIEHDPDSDTCRIEVRLARGPLRSPLRMRLDIDRWSSSPSSTALELIPSARVRPAASYFRAGHLVLDRLTQRLRLEREILESLDPFGCGPLLHTAI
jgi:hypothetical protein